MTDRVGCRTPDCTGSARPDDPAGFCYSCLGRLAREWRQLADDLDKTLRLEAEFVRYCSEHGLPNPHE